MNAPGSGSIKSARFQKAVQRLREAGTITDSPADIGALMRELHADLDAEVRSEVADALLKWAWADIKRKASRGLPEWYKEKLTARQFGENGEDPSP